MKRTRYTNKRAFTRSGGRFAKPNPASFGLAGFCESCGAIKVRHYDADPRDRFPDPRSFRDRCFNCEPKTQAEIALDEEIEASKPKQPTIADLLKINEVTR